MVKFSIDDRALEVKEGLTVLRAALDAGIDIPHFCYHPAFPPEGSCRMCLVEIEGLPKLELACSTAVREGLKVSTKSVRVMEARKAVLEFLLAEHPLDCPICDKAGECRLQDYFDEYGLFESQLKDAKEKREKKILIGQKLILDRERCILCTRCVRFLAAVTKTGELGVVDRGNHSEISVHESEPINNNYSGNLVDLCPVGAITDTDFRFKARVWFLTPQASICPLCGRGCNILVDVHPGFPRVLLPQRVYRIRPRENPEVNGHWLCDFGRSSYAYLDRSRQDRLLQKKGGRETELTWEKALQILSEKVNSLVLLDKAQRIAVILNTTLTNEELFLADRIFRRRLGLRNVFVVDPPAGKADGLLLTAERTPNRRGAKEIGLPLAAPDLPALAENADLLLIFGHFLASTVAAADLKAAFEKIGAKYLWASHASPLDALVDMVIPTPVIAEKSGTVTNVDGRVQGLSPALDFCAGGLPEWQALVDLAKALKVDHQYFWPLVSAAAVTDVMKKEIPFFG
jgi:NADH-quinone oxidoreductase subunit G